MHRTHNTADSSTLWPSLLRSVRARSTKFAMVTAAIAVEFRCKLNFKSFEFNYLCAHNLVAARRIELPSQP